MDKRPDLIKWAETKIGLPFVWGKSDCTTIVIEGISLYYGIELPVINTWTSLKDALKAFKQYNSPDNILKNTGFSKVPKNFEQTGDILVWKGRGYYLLGFVINGEVMVADEGSLLEMRPLNSFQDYNCFRR